MLNELMRMFLGNSPKWYKSTIIAFLILNPFILFVCNLLGLNGGFIVGWIFLLEFIFTLALALKCYPLQPGGLLAIQAIALGLTTPYHVLYEIEHNLEVILLLIFMVAGIFFMKNLMLSIFTSLLLKVKSTLKQRDELKRLSDIFRARIIDVTDTTYTIELTGPTEKILAFIDSLGKIKIIEQVRSGALGISRGSESLEIKK